MEKKEMQKKYNRTLAEYIHSYFLTHNINRFDLVTSQDLLDAIGGSRINRTGIPNRNTNIFLDQLTFRYLKKFHKS